jgi:hypothetical protein
MLILFIHPAHAGGPLHFETHARKIAGTPPTQQQCDQLAALLRASVGKKKVTTSFTKAELTHIYNPADYAGDMAPWNVSADGDTDIQNVYDLSGTACHIAFSLAGKGDDNINPPENLLNGKEIMSADGCGLSGGSFTSANAQYVCEEQHRGECLKESPQCCGDDDPGCDNCEEVEWNYTYDCFALPAEFKAPSVQLKTSYTVENKYDRKQK